MASKRVGRKTSGGGAGVASAADVAKLNAILGDGDADANVASDLRARAEAVGSRKFRDGGDAAELLSWAAGNGRADLVAAMLKRGADPDAAAVFNLPPYDPHDEDHEWTEADWFAQEDEPARVALRPLGAAVHGGQVKTARLLIDAGADVNADAGSGPPIYHAVRRGHAGVVELLVARGADLSVRGGIGQTLLYEVAGSTHADVAELLLRAGADPNELSGSGSPPLIAASIRGDVRIVRALLAAGANVDPPEPTLDDVTNATLRTFAASGSRNFSPPLVHAAEIGHVEVVRTLLEAGADVRRKNSHGSTAYDVARLKGHREVAELLRKAGAAGPGTAKPIDLFTAAETGDVNAIRQALASGINVNAKSGVSEKGLGAVFERGKIDMKGLIGRMMGAAAGNDPAMLDALEHDAAAMREGAAWQHGMTALMIAAKGGHAEAVRALLAAGANVAEPSSDPHHSGHTALHYAAYEGHVDVMRILLDAGADAAARGFDVLGEPTHTPLQHVADRGNVEVIKLLLERGARPSEKSVDGGDVLETAACGGSVEVLRLLLEHGAKVRRPDGKRRTALHNAVANGRVDVARFVLDRGIGANAASEDGTPLHAATAALNVQINRGQRDDMLTVVQVLLGAGADPNRLNGRGETPLYRATIDAEFVRLLLAHKADPNIRGKDGRTALHSAARRDSVEPVRLLLAAGADVNVADRDKQTALDVAIENHSRYAGKVLEAAGAKRGRELAPKKKRAVPKRARQPRKRG